MKDKQKKEKEIKEDVNPKSIEHILDNMLDGVTSLNMKGRGCKKPVPFC